MAAQKFRPYGVEWEPHLEEILDYYVTQDHTEAETIRYLWAKHKFTVTYVSLESIMR